MNVVGSKRVFHMKQKADGSVDGYKVQLIARGFHQHEGLDLRVFLIRYIALNLFTYGGFNLTVPFK